jgi:hypothetical protein
MGYLHQIDTTRGLAVVRLGGVITGHVLTEAVSSLFMDTNWRPYYGHVWDTRSVNAFSVEAGDIKAVKMLIDSFKDPGLEEEGRTAIVISGRISDFLVEVGHIIMELCRRPVMFFSEIEEATYWVDGVVQNS